MAINCLTKQLLDRDSFRAVCDREKTAGAIRRALEAGTSAVEIDVGRASPYDPARPFWVMISVRPQFLHGRGPTMSFVPGFSALLDRGGVTSSHRSRRHRFAKPAAVASHAESGGADTPKKLVYATSIASGLAFSAAWLMTETVASAILGWVAAALLIYSVRRSRAYGRLIAAGSSFTSSASTGSISRSSGLAAMGS